MAVSGCTADPASHALALWTESDQYLGSWETQGRTGDLSLKARPHELHV